MQSQGAALQLRKGLFLGPNRIKDAKGLILGGFILDPCSLLDPKIPVCDLPKTRPRADEFKICSEFDPSRDGEDSMVPGMGKTPLVSTPVLPRRKYGAA